MLVSEKTDLAMLPGRRREINNNNRSLFTLRWVDSVNSDIDIKVLEELLNKGDLWVVYRDYYKLTWEGAKREHVSCKDKDYDSVVVVSLRWFILLEK